MRKTYDLLYRHYGPQHWWPADSPFEVMVGAILTQNTAWSNVESAIANLRKNRCLDPERIVTERPERLARWIKPSGYFNIKAKRLQNYCRWYLEQGGWEALSKQPTSRLRHALLSVNGIGPETADDILLYAFGRPVFVIDAYTRRLFSRLGMIRGDEAYETLRTRFETELGTEDPQLFNEYHALIVRHAKEACRKRADCSRCCLASNDHCPQPQRTHSSADGPATAPECFSGKPRDDGTR